MADYSFNGVTIRDVTSVEYKRRGYNLFIPTTVSSASLTAAIPEANCPHFHSLSETKDFISQLSSSVLANTITVTLA